MSLPDVQAQGVAYLDANMTTRVSTGIPNPRPAELVRLTLVGGAGVINRRVAQARLSVECWAASAPRAFAIASEVFDLLSEWPDYESRCSFPQAFYDPVSSSPRYVFTAELWGLTVSS